MLNKDILDSYKITKSMRKTAAELGVATATVKKVLITYGVYSTPLTKRIVELRAAGMPTKDIAELLHVAPTTVAGNSAYEKGSYLNTNKSENAIRIQECRERKAHK